MLVPALKTRARFIAQGFYPRGGPHSGKVRVILVFPYGLGTPQEFEKPPPFHFGGGYLSYKCAALPRPDEVVDLLEQSCGKSDMCSLCGHQDSPLPVGLMEV